MQQEKFIEHIQQIITNYLEKRGFLTHEWQYGTVLKVNEDNTLHLQINGSMHVTTNVPSNPDIDFEAGNSVWVHFVNRNPNNLFVPYKRLVKPELEA